jgi:hypothetical protein
MLKEVAILILSAASAAADPISSGTMNAAAQRI